MDYYELMEFPQRFPEGLLLSYFYIPMINHISVWFLSSKFLSKGLRTLLLSRCIWECLSYDCWKLSEIDVKLKFIYHWSFSWIASPVYLFTLHLIKAKGNCRSQVSHIYPMTFSMFRFGYLSYFKFSTISNKMVFCSVYQVKFIIKSTNACHDACKSLHFLHLYLDIWGCQI